MKRIRLAGAIAIVGSMACAAHPSGLPPGSVPAPARVGPDGALSGAALGFALGSEAHVFLADSGFAAVLYAHVLRPALGPGAPPTLEEAVRRRGVLTVGAERFRRQSLPPRASDALLVHVRGRVPARVILARVHRPGYCTVREYVTELVLEIPEWARAAAPPPQSPVVALLHPMRTGDDPAQADVPAPALDPGSARALVSLAALAAESASARSAAEPPGAPLPVPVALDANRAADAGEVVVLPGRHEQAAVGLRIRFLADSGGTVLVSGVGVSDTLGRNLRWLLAPTRMPLTDGLAASGGRYSLRGALAGPPVMLLVDEVVDVGAAASRLLAIAPRGAALVAARPLALRCP